MHAPGTSTADSGAEPVCQQQDIVHAPGTRGRNNAQSAEEIPNADSSEPPAKKAGIDPEEAEVPEPPLKIAVCQQMEVDSENHREVEVMPTPEESQSSDME